MKPADRARAVLPLCQALHVKAVVAYRCQYPRLHPIHTDHARQRVVLPPCSLWRWQSCRSAVPGLYVGRKAHGRAQRGVPFPAAEDVTRRGAVESGNRDSYRPAARDASGSNESYWGGMDRRGWCAKIESHRSDKNYAAQGLLEAVEALAVALPEEVIRAGLLNGVVRYAGSWRVSV